MPPCTYAVLRPSLDVALARARSREGAERIETAAVAGLHEEFADLGAYERHSIDSSQQTTEATSELMRRLLDEGALRL